jgi:cytidine deaminase
VYTGTNVENASFGLTICAERAAVCQAVAAGEREFVAIAIAGDDQSPTPPCGACRQVLQEFAPRLRILLAGHGDGWEEWGLEELLPRAFVTFNGHGSAGAPPGPGGAR